MNGKYVYVFTMNGVKSSSFSYIYISPFHITVAEGKQLSKGTGVVIEEVKSIDLGCS